MALTTYTAVGNLDDVSDIITNIAPSQTPLYSAFGRTEASASFHEWLEDDLAAPGANKAVEGADYAVADAAPRSRIGNYTQIFTKGYGVSGTQEAVMKAGVTSEIAYQMAKAMKEAARDIEYAYVTSAAAVAGDAATPREMGGVKAFIGTNVLDNGGTPRALTEDLLNEAIQSAWSKGGEPDTVVVSAAKKREISAFAANSSRTVSADDKKLVAAVDVYESDFGLVTVVASRWMADDEIFVLESGKWKTAYLRPLAVEEKGRSGDRIEKVIVGELTLEARAEKSGAVISDLS